MFEKHRGSSQLQIALSIRHYVAQEKVPHNLQINQFMLVYSQACQLEIFLGRINSMAVKPLKYHNFPIERSDFHKDY